MGRVLIVDDNEDTIGMVSMAVSHLGHEAVGARNVKQTIDAIRCYDIDLVLLDFMMPDVDGIETLKHIRLVPGTETLPVYMSTASYDHGLEEKWYRAGGAGFLKKPISLQQLEEVILKSGCEHNLKFFSAL